MAQFFEKTAKEDRNMSETTYYSDGEFQVTNARAVLRGKTYAMANITSVAVGAKEKSRWWIVLISLGVFLGLFLVAQSFVNWSILLPVVGLPALGLGIFLAVSLPRKYIYTVRIGSASGETDALASTNKEHIEKIVKAMNQAIIERG
jgi:hypothetical protein